VAVLVSDADALIELCEDVIAEVARRVWAHLGPPATPR
jgi:hypothetical protein